MQIILLEIVLKREEYYSQYYIEILTINCFSKYFEFTGSLLELGLLGGRFSYDLLFLKGLWQVLKGKS